MTGNKNMGTITVKNSSSQTLEITLTAETKQELEHFIAEKGWERAEGYRILLGAGLGYLRSQPYQEAESDSEAEREKKQLMANPHWPRCAFACSSCSRPTPTGS